MACRGGQRPSGPRRQAPLRGAGWGRGGPRARRAPRRRAISPRSSWPKPRGAGGTPSSRRAPSGAFSTAQRMTLRAGQTEGTLLRAHAPQPPEDHRVQGPAVAGRTDRPDDAGGSDELRGVPRPWRAGLRADLHGRDIVVIDTLPARRTAVVRDVNQTCGARLRFLSPSLPDFNSQLWSDTLQFGVAEAAGGTG
jgi:hypothetical protein